MKWSSIWHLGIKELRSLRRDPMMLVLIVYAFTLAIYTAATSMPETLNRATIAIVDEDESQLSLRIRSALYPPYFVSPRVISLEEMDRRMDEGLDTFALVIPSGFQRDVLAGRQPQIQLNVDATRMTQAFVGNAYVQSIVAGEVTAFLAHYRASPTLPIELTERVRFNPTLNHAWFGAIMEVINNVVMLSIVLTGAALIREREHGTIEHLLVMPLSPFEIMISKVWAMALVVLVAAMLSVLLVVQGLLGVPIEGSLVLFGIGLTVNLFATTSIGIFLATLARSMPQFGLLMMLVLLPLLILSGGLTPKESMPEAVQMVMFLSPTTHFVAFAQGVLYRGAGISVVWPQLLAMAVIGTGLFAAALSQFRSTISRMA